MRFRRLALELAVVAIVAAIAAIVLSRMYLAPTLGGIAPHRAEPRVVAPEPAATVAVASPENSGPAAAHSGVPAEIETRVEPSPLPAARPTRQPLTLDLRGVRDPGTLIPGAVIVANPGPEGGYVVRANDRAGFLASAGVRPGDVLVAINGQPTTSADQLLAAYVIVHTAPALSLRFRRGSRQFDVVANVLR